MAHFSTEPFPASDFTTQGLFPADPITDPINIHASLRLPSNALFPNAQGLPQRYSRCPMTTVMSTYSPALDDNAATAPSKLGTQ